MRKASREEVNRAIQGGIVFRKASSGERSDTGSVKTKARKKAYITGAHGSASARKKAAIRQARQQRNSRRK
ncbi:MAG: hypothetical protein IJS89_07270 [Bacteroidaceae bacterium]|nr:hypothetical protein [Bacteroidaceae bacterium]